MKYRPGGAADRSGWDVMFGRQGRWWKGVIRLGGGGGGACEQREGRQLVGSVAGYNRRGTGLRFEGTTQARIRSLGAEGQKAGDVGRGTGHSRRRTGQGTRQRVCLIASQPGREHAIGSVMGCGMSSNRAV